MSVATDFFLGGGGGGFGQPQMPPAKIGSNGHLSNAMHLPMFSFSNGNTLFRTPTQSTNTSNTCQLVDSTGSVFSVSLSDINTQETLTLTYWAGLYWYDNVDLLFYCLVVDDTTANSVYLITISKTGTIVLVGSDTIANWTNNAPPPKSGAQSHWVRATQGSGDFTISIGSSDDRTVISSSDGTVQSTTADFNLVGGTDTPELNGAYISRDGRVMIGSGTVYDLGGGESVFNGLSIQRKNAAGVINMQQTMPNLLGHAAGSNFWGLMKFIEWDGGILLTATASATNFSSGSPVVGVRQWEIAEFDEWLHDMCTYLGLAEKT